MLVFSALPFLSVQALADSDLGKRLRVSLCPGEYCSPSPQLRAASACRPTSTTTSQSSSKNSRRRSGRASRHAQTGAHCSAPAGLDQLAGPYTWRCRSMWYGPERPRWLGPLSYSYPQHLRGDAPGDYGALEQPRRQLPLSGQDSPAGCAQATTLRLSQRSQPTLTGTSTTRSCTAAGRCWAPWELLCQVRGNLCLPCTATC